MASSVPRVDSRLQSHVRLLDALRAAVPPGLDFLVADDVARLRRITDELLTVHPEARMHCASFAARRRRELPVAVDLWRSAIADRTVLVTGGTGCIGTVLLEQLGRFGPRRVVSVSRGVHSARLAVPGVEYRYVDIRDAASVGDLMKAVSPDVVFHLAAQRDPGLAEHAVALSVETNVIGTRNLLEASAAVSVESFIYASTGKAVRPYTPHVYAATKKIGELLTLVAARQQRSARYSIARFTHIVDNSLVLRKFRGSSPAGVIKLHDPTTLFYTQSAREAVQLLLYAHAASSAGPSVEINAIRDLGLPAELLPLALGVVAEGRSARALYINGYESGYDDAFYPGLYDPETAADTSPLLNAFEAAHVSQHAEIGVDASLVCIANPERLSVMIAGWESLGASTSDSASIRDELNHVSTQLLHATIGRVDRSRLERAVRLTSPWRATMSSANLVIDDGVRAALASRSSTG